MQFDSFSTSCVCLFTYPLCCFLNLFISLLIQRRLIPSVQMPLSAKTASNQNASGVSVVETAYSKTHLTHPDATKCCILVFAGYRFSVSSTMLLLLCQTGLHKYIMHIFLCAVYSLISFISLVFPEDVRSSLPYDSLYPVFTGR